MCDSLKPQQWYWIRREDGSLAPYRFHQYRHQRGRRMGEFFVGSMVQTFPLSYVVGRAEMPELYTDQPPSSSP